MSNSSFSGDDDLVAGSTVEGSGETVDSATADREAAFDDPVSSAAGTVTRQDAVVANPSEDSTVMRSPSIPDRETSQEPTWRPATTTPPSG